MKRTNLAVVTVLLFAAISSAAQSAGEKSFNTMKSLTGEWEGKDQTGAQVDVSYHMTGGGSALMSEIRSSKPGHNEDMISMIHMEHVSCSRIIARLGTSPGCKPQSRLTARA